MAQETLDEFKAKATKTFSSVITVNQTTYNIQDNWLKLAAKYFNIDTTQVSSSADLAQDNNRISLLKAGLFGYFNEIASTEIKSATFYKNMMYEEHFVNSASFPESIYNHAKLYNVEISTATPSHMGVNLIVRRDDLLNSPLKTELIADQYVDIKTLKTYELIIDRSYEFSVDKYKFLLPYSVQILMKQTSALADDYTITARYMTSENNFPFMDINSPEIKIYQDATGSDRMVYLNLDIYQLNSNPTEYSVMSEDISDNLFYTVPFTDQLATFNVYYEYEGEEVLLKKYFNNTFTPEDPNEKFCYYTFIDDDKIQISFSNLANSFRPRYNSRLRIETLTTFGQTGNFAYEGEILFNFSSTASSNYSKMLAAVYPITSASGGRDKLTLSGEKQKIIQAALTRENLIMDSDLEHYFKNLDNKDSYNNSQMTFLKKRDDVLMRLYSSFLLMKDKDQKVLPTNTAPYSVITKKFFDDNNEDPKEGLIIPEHSIFKFDKATGKYVHYEKGLDDKIKEELKDKNNMIYVNPFLTKIDIEPVLQANYYKLDISKDFNMNYSYINNMVPTTLLINKVNINKATNFEEDLNSDTYTISFDLNSNETINDLENKIKIRGVLVSKKYNTKYGYFEFKREDPENSQSRYTGRVSTNRKFKDNLLSLSDSLYDSEGSPIENQFIEEDLVLKVGVLYKDSSLNNTNDNAETDLFTDAFPNKKEEKLNINDYTLALSVTTIDDVKLYRNLTNVMTSIVSRVPVDNKPNDNKDFRIELIPLVSLNYFTYNFDYMYNVLERYIEILEGVVRRLENNTTVDLKFYNTYGPSKYWYLNTYISGDDTKYNLITRTDFIIDFTLHLYSAIDDAIDGKIKKFISDFVEASNSDGVIAISNLIRLLEENFSIIRYIEFNGLAGEYGETVVNKYQKIQNRSVDLISMPKQEIIDYVPEFVNVKKNLVDNSVVVTNEAGETQEVSLVGKNYEYVINLNYSLN